MQPEVAAKSSTLAAFILTPAGGMHLPVVDHSIADRWSVNAWYLALKRSKRSGTSPRSPSTCPSSRGARRATDADR